MGIRVQRTSVTVKSIDRGAGCNAVASPGEMIDERSAARAAMPAIESASEVDTSWKMIEAKGTKFGTSKWRKLEKTRHTTQSSLGT